MKRSWRQLRRMLVSRWIQVAVVGAILSGISIHPQAAQTRQTVCVRAVVEGEIQAGQRWSQPIGQGLQLMLEPLASGWILRVLPQAGARPAHDYAELATPPYQSVSPLLISTDFSFRAQDAVGWNPRRFRFAASAEDYRSLLKAYEAYRSTQAANAAAQTELVKLVGRMPQGMFEILDARLVPGTADQTSAAATVALHFTSTAHTLDMPATGKPTPLGRLNWVRFRISLDLPPAFRSDPRVQVQKRPCD